MDHIIYRNYIGNRRSFIYCSLAFTLSASLEWAYSDQGFAGVSRRSAEQSQISIQPIHVKLVSVVKF